MNSPARKLTLFALAWPIFGEQLLHVAVGTVDTFMVSHVSDDAVAALGQAGQVVWMAITLFMFVGIGSSIVITHHLGARDRPGADRVAIAAIAANTWIGLVVSILLYLFARPMLRALQMPDRRVQCHPELLPRSCAEVPSIDRHDCPGHEGGCRRAQEDCRAGNFRRLGPAAERRAMLDLLVAPGAGDLLEGRIVVEHVAEISRIVAAIALDHGGGLDDPQDLRIAHRIPDAEIGIPRLSAV